MRIAVIEDIFLIEKRREETLKKPSRNPQDAPRAQRNIKKHWLNKFDDVCLKTA